MSFKHLLVDKNEAIGIITLNRPEVLNALNRRVWLELRDVIDEMLEDESIKVLILTGAGRAFSAGVDIKSTLSANTIEEQEAYLRLEYDMSEYIEKIAKPVIAAINGYCLGNAFMLALSCDIRIAADDAKFGLPECFLGTISPMQQLVRVVGLPRAKEIAFTGRNVDAVEAERIGLVTKVVPNDKLIDEAKLLAQRIIDSFAPIALKYTKFAAYLASPNSESAIRFENQSALLCFLGEDGKEGGAAFAEKRKPKFKGMAVLNPFKKEES